MQIRRASRDRYFSCSKKRITKQQISLLMSLVFVLTNKPSVWLKQNQLIKEQRSFSVESIQLKLLVCYSSTILCIVQFVKDVTVYSLVCKYVLEKKSKYYSQFFLRSESGHEFKWFHAKKQTSNWQTRQVSQSVACFFVRKTI